ncbi:MAG TPA: BON domain-containing protein [Bacteroidia bacterium]|jgi:osmotically-inducible protein OsmY|nr:BON domain-containing protein [Bacteroidia bacterium]
MKTDTQIQRDILDELEWEPTLAPGEIKVDVKEGIVFLSGSVDSFNKKIIAEQAANRVYGTKAVEVDITVDVDPKLKKTDTEITGIILDILRWHSAVKEDKVKVDVQDGWVTLTGEVEWEFQKRAVKRVIENLVGVRGITNNLEVVPQTNVADIKEKISKAFQRNATIDASKIIIETKGDKVILKGNVNSLHEKYAAAKAAWFAPGVRSVENKLQVENEVLAY